MLKRKQDQDTDDISFLRKPVDNVIGAHQMGTPKSWSPGFILCYSKTCRNLEKFDKAEAGKGYQSQTSGTLGTRVKGLDYSFQL